MRALGGRRRGPRAGWSGQVGELERQRERRLRHQRAAGDTHRWASLTRTDSSRASTRAVICEGRAGDGAGEQAVSRDDACEGWRLQATATPTPPAAGEGRQDGRAWHRVRSSGRGAWWCRACWARSGQGRRWSGVGRGLSCRGDRRRVSWAGEGRRPKKNESLSRLTRFSAPSPRPSDLPALRPPTPILTHHVDPHARHRVLVRPPCSPSPRLRR